MNSRPRSGSSGQRRARAASRSGFDSATEVVARAKRYPFSPAKGSCLYINGFTVPISHYASDTGSCTVVTPYGPETAATYLARRGIASSAWAVPRYPVLALGSNASPWRLSEKLSGIRGDVVIPMVRAQVQDFVVGYSAHFAAYGSIPSTLHHSPGACAVVFVIGLAEPQLMLMHESESLGLNYSFVRLRDVRTAISPTQGLTEVCAYISRHGCLHVNGNPLGPGLIDAAMSQTEVLSLAQGLVGADGDLDSFIYENATNAKIRDRRAETLKAYARGFSYPLTEVIADG